MNLFTCGKCGKDFKDHPRRNAIMQKVRLAGYANILCFTCRCKFEDEVKDIAKNYLAVDPETSPETRTKEKR